MLDAVLKQIEKTFSETPTSEWINSPEVEERQKEDLSETIEPVPSRAYFAYNRKPCGPRHIDDEA
jgi:hypothetical protein